MKQYNDLELVEEYKKVKRCRIVAEKYGCSDETVRRALIKLNVPRVERKPRPETKPKIEESEKLEIVKEYYSTNATINDLAKKFKRSQYTASKAIDKYGHGRKRYKVNSKKIYDTELILEATYLNPQQIAIKHNMSVENVIKRAKKIGVALIPCEYSHWKGRAKRYEIKEFDYSITIDKLIERDKGICQICGLPIDRTDVANGHIRRNYPTVDHIIPLSKGGSHTWNNIQLAHMKCNAGKCDRITV